MAGLIDVREGEWRRLIPLALAYGLVLASVYVLKPVRNALFLDRLGAAQLPYVLMLVALVGGVAAAFYSRFTRSVRIDRLLTATFLFLIVNLLAFKWLFTVEQTWVYYAFYVWVNLYGLLAVSLLWLLANAVFNPREARRLFGLIGSGGIGGAILGGTFTGWASERLGTESLVFVCIAILTVCAVLVKFVRPVEQAAPAKDRAAHESAFSVVRRVPLLRLIAWMAAIAAMIAAVIDVQFNEVVDRAFVTKDAKTAFFGSFFAYLNAFAFLFQLLLTPRILRVAGVGTALFFLPIAMGLGSAGLLLLPGLLGGIAVKVGDLGFRHSIHKSAMEILYLPVPADLKNKAKVFLDATVDNLATGVGALLVLVLTGVAGVGFRSLAFLSLGLVAVWGWLLLRTRRAYVDAFRQALDRREIDFEDIRSDFTEASVESSLLGALSSDNDRHVVYALETLYMMGTVRQPDAIKPLLDHPTAEVREKALLVLAQAGADLTEDELAPRLDDIHFPVRVEAAHALISGPAPVTADTFLKSEDTGRRLVGLGYVTRYGSLAEKAAIDPDTIESLLGGEASNETVRTEVARALGHLPHEVASPYLERLKADPSESVVRQTTLSLGRLRRPEDLPWLIDQLGERRYRLEAREALSALGESVLDDLASRLDDRETPRVRQSLPPVLGRIPSQRSADILAERLGKNERALEFQLVKALNKLRQLAPDVRLDEGIVRSALLREIEHYYHLVHARLLISEAEKTASVALLLRALSEQADRTLELVFRLLGLQYPPRDVYHSYLGLVSANRTVRASAIEFLDNILTREDKEALIPILESGSDAAVVEAGRELFGQKFWTVDEALGFLIRGDDEWVRVCAIHSVRDRRSPDLVRLVDAQRDDPSPLVAETASLALQGS